MKGKLFLLVLVFVISSNAAAEECFSPSDLHEMFKTSIKEFCGSFSNTGSSTKLEFNGKIDIQSMGLFKKIAGELGTEVLGSASSEEYDNVEREDLVEDKEATRQCNIVYAKIKMEMVKNRCKQSE